MVMKDLIISIANDFTEMPGPRYRSEGSYSGQDFRETILEPAFKKARKNKCKLIIDLDSGYGYGTSFLEESFGGLARKFSIRAVLETLEFRSMDDPSLNEVIRSYINDSEDRF